ncbi:class I SAM-dependent methyltransferase [Telmatospirillum sp.]|uniref:class I SAM-dependent methyltransferase n=1 Tax=Telmatospirillum sp. TaxID=2079197 RepID=UPI00284B0F1A|nr:class I SAM-dependent methyltransferase [Telmatospirillum sp.]MDR3437065.1 class I SAM-dependent methyltransferase [Telmatospirillum sp.]
MPPFERICHLRGVSPWIERFAPLVPAGARVLDLACGGGRHSRFFLERGALVTCVDRNISAVSDLAGTLEIIEADLEANLPWPLADRTFDAVVVVNYLYRPLFPRLIEAVAPGGLFLYETFALGNERYDRPSDPKHLLRPGELLSAVAGALQVVAYETGVERHSVGPKVVQRICAARTAEPVPLDRATI